MKLYRRVLDGVDPGVPCFFIPLSSVKKKVRAFDSPVCTFSIEVPSCRMLATSYSFCAWTLAAALRARSKLPCLTPTTRSYRSDVPSGECALCIVPYAWRTSCSNISCFGGRPRCLSAKYVQFTSSSMLPRPTDMDMQDMTEARIASLSAFSGLGCFRDFQRYGTQKHSRRFTKCMMESALSASWWWVDSAQGCAGLRVHARCDQRTPSLRRTVGWFDDIIACRPWHVFSFFDHPNIVPGRRLEKPTSTFRVDDDANSV